jgi:uncharacterized membrane protein
VITAVTFVNVSYKIFEEMKSLFLREKRNRKSNESSLKMTRNEMNVWKTFGLPFFLKA